MGDGGDCAEDTLGVDTNIVAHVVLALGYRVQSPIAVLPPLRGTADFKKMGGGKI